MRRHADTQIGGLWAASGHTAGAADAALVDYVRSLEALFVEVRGRGVQWSPEDGALAVGWFHSGVELPTIARVLAERTAAWRYRNADRPLPRSLGWLRTPVERGALPGAGAPALPDAPSPWETLDALATAGERIASTHIDPAISQPTRAAARALRRLRDKDDAHADTQGLLDRVARIRARLVKRCLEGLGPSATAQLEVRAAAALPPGLTGADAERLLQARLIEQLDAAHQVALPWWSGWQRPSTGENS